MRRRRPAHELRIAVDCLPLTTRQAMLEGIDANRIIVGAYVDREGGVCPMLAAHRRGGRTSLASFARSWDRYTKAGRGPRPATERELLTLRTMLEASIALDTEPSLDDVAAEHREVKRRNAAAHREQWDTGERDRTDELKDRHGWAWSRLFRRYDAYQVALEQLQELERSEAPAEERERELV